MSLSPAPQASLPSVRIKRTFSMLGVAISIESTIDAAIELVDDTYGAFAAPADPDAFVIEVLTDPEHDSFGVTGPAGVLETTGSLDAALIAVLNCVAATVVRGLYDQGLLAVHAGAVVHRGRALVVAGPSGYGKTTVTLGLVRAGLGLLSDELAVLDPRSRRVLPYRRSAHVRPMTRVLVPELEPVCNRPRRDLGDGNEWVISPIALESVFPGCLAADSPLGAVLVLDGPPEASAAAEIESVPAAVAVMELLRGTPAAAIDFGESLGRIATALDGVRCGRLRGGTLDCTVDAVVSWLEEKHGARGPRIASPDRPARVIRVIRTRRPQRVDPGDR